MAKKVDVIDLFNNGVLAAELHYTKINADFKPSIIAAAVLERLYFHEANIEGQKITAEYLAAPDKESAAVPKNAVDLIKFQFEHNELTVPANIFTNEALGKIVPKMTKKSIVDHYENRKATTLDDFELSELKELYVKTTESITSNPLMSEALAIDAIGDINPKMLQYSNVKANHTNIDTKQLADFMKPKVYDALKQQQAENQIVPFDRKVAKKSSAASRELDGAGAGV